MRHNDVSDWGSAVRAAAEPLPAPMDPQHRHRAQTLVFGYCSLSVLAAMVMLIMSQTGVPPALVGISLGASLLTAVIATVSAASGRLANWAEPLTFLTLLDSTEIKTALFQTVPSQGVTRDLIWLLAERYTFGSSARLTLNSTTAAIFLLLALSAAEFPLLAGAFSVSTLVNVLLVFLETRRRRTLRKVLGEHR